MKKAFKDPVPLVKVLMPPKECLMEKLEEVLYSGMIAEGRHVYEFEENFSDTFKLNNVVAMSSGTAALHSALYLSGIRNGEEVITTPMTAEPTNLAILHAGGKPIFADVDPTNGNICPDSIESLISTKTKVILVVHYAGYPVNILKIRDIADKNNLILIEDCAHSLGASANNKPIGSFGDFAIFSFQAIKHMTTVDGGALIIKNPELLERAKRFRWFGLSKSISREENNIYEIGFKYNMHNVAAIIGTIQLRNILGKINSHIENANYYNQELSKDSSCFPARVYSNTQPSYWLYTFLTKNSQSIIERLNTNNVMASKLHKPNNLHTIFNSKNISFPGLNEFYQSLVHIPCGWWVDSETREKIVALINNK